MTNEQTVSVPVAALKRLRDERDLRFVDSAGALYSVRDTAMTDLLAAITAPPKVGDALTADQIRDLPDTAVMRDEDGDVLVKVRDTVRRVTMDRRRFDTITWQGQQINGLVIAYTVTLISLPDDRG